MEFYKSTVEQVFKELNTSEKGLAQEEVKKRLEQYGHNILKAKEKISAWKIFLQQFNSPIVWILIVAVVVSLFVGEAIDAIIIGIILVLNAGLGFIQEYKAEKSIEALKKMISLKAIVIRGDKEEIVDAKDLVPGDIILLEEGSKVPADSRLIESIMLDAQESALTGESVPVSKKIDAIKNNAQVADQKNMIFSGTIITKGKGKAIVVHTGMKTEIGKIATLIGEAEKKLTPLQIKLAALSKWLGILVLIISAVVFLIGWLTGRGTMLEMFIAAIALAVAAIPEGLPAVVTISLALGVKRMIKRNALMRKLPSVETLGSTSVICSDKTGTLTHNQMTVTKVYVNGNVTEVSGVGYKAEGKFSTGITDLKLLLRIGTLCNDAAIEDEECIGDPTEGSLIVSAAKAGLLKKTLEKEFPRIGEFPFTSERKVMTTLHKIEGKKKAAYVKGAPDVIVSRCTHVYENGKVSKLTQDKKDKILEQNSKFAQQALRVIGCAYKEFITETSKETEVENNLIFVGLQAMIDPPREEVKESIAKCHKAGIKVVMITGDHKETAMAIAKDLGIEGKALMGEELDKNNIDDIVEDISIYARVNPSHKMKIVEALQKKGHVVAMTGDGVNDAPALKNANIGISMGISGTDVAKEASDMILTDDNFTSIVNAVEEGRSIYDNIKKFVNYLLSSNLGEVMVIFVASLIGLPLPLLAIHILWMNLVTDGLPALALGVDPVDPGIMEQKPRKKDEKIISKNMILNIFLIGVIITVTTLFFFNRHLNEGLEFARTAALLTLVLLQLVRVQMVRAKYNSSLFSNPYLIFALVSSLALQALIIYTPLNTMFKLTAMPLMVWVEIIIACVVMYIVGIFGNKIITKLTKEVD